MGGFDVGLGKGDTQDSTARGKKGKGREQSRVLPPGTEQLVATLEKARETEGQEGTRRAARRAW